MQPDIKTEGLALTTSAQTLLETPSGQRTKLRVLMISVCNTTGSGRTVTINFVKVGTGAGTFALASGLSVPANSRVQLSNDGAALVDLAYSGSSLDKIQALADANSALDVIVTYAKGGEVRVT